LQAPAEVVHRGVQIAGRHLPPCIGEPAAQRNTGAAPAIDQTDGKSWQLLLRHFPLDRTDQPIDHRRVEMIIREPDLDT
jgi:hypothetical protein